MSTHLDDLYDRAQALLAGLDAHRRENRGETPEERTRRQRHRAEACARALGTTRPSVVRAMFALVVADELPAPQGDPVPPVAPGARAALKPKKSGKSPAKKAQAKTPPPELPVEIPGQGTLW